MGLKLFLLVTVVPLVELYLLIQLGGLVGPWPTLGLVVGTGLAGAWMLRRQGSVTLYRIREKLNGGELPTVDLIDGLLIVAAGLLLITPGVLTDLTGIVLILPPGRAAVRKLLRSRWEQWLRQHQVDPPLPPDQRGV